MQPLGVLETCLYVDDLAVAEAFYRDVLGLELYERRAGRHVFFHCGRGMLLLFKASESLRDDDLLPPHGCQGPGHAALAITESDIAHWREHLTQHGVTVEFDYPWPHGAHSLYFRDPAGNSLELATPALWGLSEAEFS